MSGGHSLDTAGMGAGRAIGFAVLSYLAFSTADALIKLAFRRHPDGDAAVLAESKRLVRGYLQAFALT